MHEKGGEARTDWILPRPWLGILGGKGACLCPALPIPPLQVSFFWPGCTSKGDLGTYVDVEPWLEKQCTRHSQVHVCTTLACKVWSP